MGYRSTVIFGVSEDNFPKLEELLKKHEAMLGAPEIVRKNHRKDNVDNDNPNMVICKFEYLKWYNDYEEVKEITKYINYLLYGKDYNEKDHFHTTFIACLGEDGVMHSEEGDYWNYIDHISKLEIH
jgi:hypothetical protein